MISNETSNATEKRWSSRKALLACEQSPINTANDFARAFRLSVKAALQGERAQESREAIRDEVMNMLTYRVGHYIRWEDIPREEKRNVIQAFMFIKIKEKPDGSFDKVKARLVGKGNDQEDHLYMILYLPQQSPYQLY